MLERLRERVLAIPGARRVVRASLLWAGGFRGEVISLRASALTYLTLLSLVPLLAVIYSIVDLVSGHAPFHNGVQKYVNDQLGIGAGAAVAGALSEFTSKATVKTLGMIGFAVLLFSSLSLLWNIESAFNHIYAVKRARSPVQRLLKYWAFLTLGPVLLTASLAVTWKIGEMQEAHGHGHAGHSEVLHILAALSSIAITYAGFGFLYKVLPSARVRIRSALIAAFVAGTTWELAKFAFAAFSTRLVQVHKIYGPVAVLPIVLFWVYISWLVCLSGCRFAYALDASRKSELRSPLLIAAEAREVFVARVFVALVRMARSAPVRPAAIARRLEVPRRLVLEALRALEASNLCVEAKKGGWVPSREPSRVLLAELRAAGRRSLGFPAQDPDETGEALSRAFAAAEQAAEGALGESVDSLLRRVAPGGPLGVVEQKHTPPDVSPVISRIKP
ncbi:MAG: YhjD/YihY/BrkB family envelope integrity protein [Myxococcales bacterium]